MLLTVKNALEIANAVRPDIRCKTFPIWDKKLGYEYNNPECAISMIDEDLIGSMPVDFIEYKAAVQPEMCSFNIYYRELTSDDEIIGVANKAVEEALRVMRMLQAPVKATDAKDDAHTYKDVLNNIYGRQPWTVFDVLTLVSMDQFVKVALINVDAVGKKKTMFLEGDAEILLKQEMLQHYVALKISVGTEDSDSDLFIEAVNGNDVCK